jgi:uncharacterized damage-inducible protein DinB
MDDKEQLEFWQRGPVPGIIPLLQPAAHAILQARQEVEDAIKNLPNSLLWQRPAAVASIAFHLQHMTGVLDRLFSYAINVPLTGQQFSFLKNEDKEDLSVTSSQLLHQLDAQVNKAIEQLKNTKEETLLEPRGVGRKQIPSNVLGLIFHAAEHMQRHTGQLIVTARILTANPNTTK